MHKYTDIPMNKYISDFGCRPMKITSCNVHMVMVISHCNSNYNSDDETTKIYICGHVTQIIEVRMYWTLGH